MRLLRTVNLPNTVLFGMYALSMKLTEKVLEDLCTITRWLNGPGKDDSIGELKRMNSFLLPQAQDFVHSVSHVLALSDHSVSTKL